MPCNLATLLVVLGLAKLAAEDQRMAMAEWAQARVEWLLPALGLERKRLPDRTTYS